MSWLGRWRYRRVSRRVLIDRVEALGKYALEMDARPMRGRARPLGRPFTLQEYVAFHERQRRR